MGSPLPSATRPRTVTYQHTTCSSTHETIAAQHELFTNKYTKRGTHIVFWHWRRRRWFIFHLFQAGLLLTRGGGITEHIVTIITMPRCDAICFGRACTRW